MAWSSVHSRCVPLLFVCGPFASCLRPVCVLFAGTKGELDDRIDVYVIVNLDKAQPCRTQRRWRSPEEVSTMNALEHQLDYPFADTLPEPGRSARSGAWRVLAAHAAALCTEPYQSGGCCAMKSTGNRDGRRSIAALRPIRSGRTGSGYSIRCWTACRCCAVIVTHCHPDHLGLAHWLCEGGDRKRWNVRLWMSLGEYMLGRVMAAGDGSNAGGEGRRASLQAARACRSGIARPAAQPQKLLRGPRAHDARSIPTHARRRCDNNRRQNVGAS